MKWLSFVQLKEIAAPTITAYERYYARFGKRVYKIDPMVMADMLGLTVKYVHLTPDNTEAVFTSVTRQWIDVYDDNFSTYPIYLDGKTILLERDLLTSDLGMGQHNFTLMHEIAHHILSRTAPDLFRQLFPSYPSTLECQMDTLASLLLMPEKLVRKALCLFDLHEGVPILNRIFYPKDYERFCDVADFLGVSKTALAIRLRQMGLLQQNYLANPYALLDVTKEVDADEPDSTAAGSVLPEMRQAAV